MSEKVYNVLFLCSGNSARSIMAECALGRYGNGRFRAFSAGSHPKGEIHPLTLHLLQRLNYRTDDLRSKSWEEFMRPEAPPLDFVFTVCDSAAAETCPGFPGQPMTAHWGVEDPVAFEGPEDKALRAFPCASTVSTVWPCRGASSRSASRSRPPKTKAETRRRSHG